MTIAVDLGRKATKQTNKYVPFSSIHGRVCVVLSTKEQEISMKFNSYLNRPDPRLGSSGPMTFHHSNKYVPFSSIYWRACIVLSTNQRARNKYEM